MTDPTNAENFAHAYYQYQHTQQLTRSTLLKQKKKIKTLCFALPMRFLTTV
jgi:exo-beta-1,3-glucanase (GH17 family)